MEYSQLKFACYWTQPSRVEQPFTLSIFHHSKAIIILLVDGGIYVESDEYEWKLIPGLVTV